MKTITKTFLSLFTAMIAFGFTNAQTFKRATSVAAGDTIIIVNKTAGMALANDAGNYRNRAAISIEADGSIILNSVSTVERLLVESTDGGFLLKSSTGYIYAEGKDKNNLKTQATATGKWSITINSGDDADVIVDNAKTDRNHLRYNTNSGQERFSCYGEGSSVQDLVSVYKKVSGSSTPEGEIELNTIEEVINMASGSLCKIKGLVVAEYSRGYIVKDATAAILIYDADYDKSRSVGDSVIVTGNAGSHGKGPQIQNADAELVNAGNIVDHGTATEINVSNAASFAGAEEVKLQYVTATGTLVKNSNYININIGAGENQISVSYPIEDLSEYADKEVVVKGYWFSVSSGKFINIMYTDIQEKSSSALQINSMESIRFDGQTIYNPAKVNLMVYNLTGALVASGNGNIDMANEAAGVYIVRAQNATLKIVKQ